MSNLPSAGGGSSLTPEEKEFLSKWTTDDATRVISTTYSVQSGLNSFKLGDMHTTHSGGENVFDQNEVSKINWFPVWQGVKPLSGIGDAITINPTSRQYTKTFELLTNGAVSTANNVPYDLDVTLQSNESILKLEVMAGEVYTGRLFYSIKNTDTNGLVKYAQFEDVDVSIGDLVEFNFTHPSESRAGDLIHVEITKENGGIFLTRSGLDTSLPWLRLSLMGYEDIEVSAGVKYITASQDVLYSTTYAVDTTGGAIDLTVSRDTGLNSFYVFDADQNFNTNACTVSFGGVQGDAVLQTKNDSFHFYYDGSQWRYLDMNTKNGGVV